MSIFPKRTIRGTTVTIHWNYNTAHLTDTAICPLVRIGVVDPMGKISMLIEKHLLALPAVQQESLRTPGQFLHLNKNLPLLVVADYLSGKHSKEALVGILQNIQAGRHFYFTFLVVANAPLGKYTLISEVISGGQVRHSKTAADDFFFVEEIKVEPAEQNEANFKSIITNLSPEPIPVKIIDYPLYKEILPTQVQAFELGAGMSYTAVTQSRHAYVSYGEERELLPLHRPEPVVCIRNPYMLELHKTEADILYLMHRQTEDAFTLSAQQKVLWLMADGMHSPAELQEVSADDYAEMQQSGLIQEIIL
ncbi:hypothetical protein [Mucilaginibacter sp.]